jgi:hypothetical protein
MLKAKGVDTQTDVHGRVTSHTGTEDEYGNRRSEPITGTSRLDLLSASEASRLHGSKRAEELRQGKFADIAAAKKAAEEKAAREAEEDSWKL